jgi:hypothetical protein
MLTNEQRWQLYLLVFGLVCGFITATWALLIFIPNVMSIVSIITTNRWIPWLSR